MKNQTSTAKKAVFSAAFYMAFALIAWLVATGRSAGFDTALRQAIVSLRNPALSAFFIPYAYSGNWFCVVPICLFLLIVPRLRKPYGLPVAASVLCAQVFYNILKRCFQRERPDWAMHLVKEHGFSFPSGHSITSFMMFGMLAMLILYYYRSEGRPLPIYKPSEKREVYFSSASGAKVAAGICIAYILLMGFARVYVGVHWPTDVLGSWCLGAANLNLLGIVFFRKK